MLAKRIKLLLFFLAVAVPYLLVFKQFFSAAPLAFGDAPFYYPENLKELFHFPLWWDFREDNFGAIQTHKLWLYLLNFSFGLLHYLLGFNGEVLERVIFYFPATTLGFFGSFFCLGQMVKNKYACFIGAIFYLFNSYFLTLMDGGQVGVGLGYALFPWAVFFHSKFFNKVGIKTGLLILVTDFLLINTDLRIFFILLFYLFLNFVLKIVVFRKISLGKRFFVLLSIVFLLLFILNLFWIIPFVLTFTELKSGGGQIGAGFIHLIDSFLLYQPHFPINEFGRVVFPPFYYGFLPLLLFLPLLAIYAQNKVFRKNFILRTILFLVFVFLAKGSNEPFGFLYAFFIEKFYLGVAFRDASKFFVPLILTSSFLLALSTQWMDEAAKKKIYRLVFRVGIYCYILLLVYPALAGRMTGVLGGRDNDGRFLVKSFLTRNNNFERQLWFGERPPQFFASWVKPVISANLLHKERPFASMIAGTYDQYNFLHSRQLPQWLDLLGIKYIFLPQDPRKKIWSSEDLNNRQKFISLVDTVSGFVRTGRFGLLPGYFTDKGQEHIFGQKKLFLVVGGDEIYQMLFERGDSVLANQGFVFAEDGRVDPQYLINLNAGSLALVFVNKDIKDLAFSFLKNKMLFVKDANFNQWGSFGNGEYLAWKEELLRRGIETYDQDYSEGILFSSQKGEVVRFNRQINTPGSYILALRSLGDGGRYKIKIDGVEYEVSSFGGQQHFAWNMVSPIELTAGKKYIEIENEQGFVAVNALALVKKEEWELVQTKAMVLTDRFPTFYIGTKQDVEKFRTVFVNSNVTIPYQFIDPSSYHVTIPQEVNWIVFSDHYSPHWHLGQTPALPFYEMINGFYVGDIKDSARPMDLKFSLF